MTWQPIDLWILVCWTRLVIYFAVCCSLGNAVVFISCVIVKVAKDRLWATFLAFDLQELHGDGASPVDCMVSVPARWCQIRLC